MRALKPRARTLMHMDEFLSEFKKTIEDGKQRLLLMADADARVGPPNRWTAKQIIGHLIDSAANNHQRFVRAQFKEDLVFPGYEQDAWVEVQKYNEEPWPDLISLWATYNLHLAHVIASMPENALTRTRNEHNLDQIAWNPVSKNSPTTLDYFVRDYVNHLRHHLNQIFGPESPG